MHKDTFQHEQDLVQQYQTEFYRDSELNTPHCSHKIQYFTFMIQEND